jgi:hypothetical protein
MLSAFENRCQQKTDKTNDAKSIPRSRKELLKEWMVEGCGGTGPGTRATAEENSYQVNRMMRVVLRDAVSVEL